MNEPLRRSFWKVATEIFDCHKSDASRRVQRRASKITAVARNLSPSSTTHSSPRRSIATGFLICMVPHLPGSRHEKHRTSMRQYSLWRKRSSMSVGPHYHRAMNTCYRYTRVTVPPLHSVCQSHFHWNDYMLITSKSPCLQFCYGQN